MHMNSEKRREYIMNALKQTDRPISASKLAKELSVSRQIIVGDVALLRASGEKVLATPRGYVIDLSVASDQYTVACVHDFDNMEKELNIMVDNGATVVNVTVEHPLYGQLTGPLHLSSRYDVEQFIKKCGENDASPLSTLTGGIHLHVLSCPNAECFERIKAQLEQAGLLYTQKQ
ncbi:MAG: transcription repressor NadR [Firmicutes bacterium CAG:24053_14]|jgi:transcriptional regulator of NAD metabolism|nr:MAG: transcription repressor NadR [Firmicutes bacterium CAG:24053_14]